MTVMFIFIYLCTLFIYLFLKINKFQNISFSPFLFSSSSLFRFFKFSLNNFFFSLLHTFYLLSLSFLLVFFFTSRFQVRFKICWNHHRFIPENIFQDEYFNPFGKIYMKKKFFTVSSSSISNV